MLVLHVVVCLVGILYLEDVNSEISEATHLNRSRSSVRQKQISRNWMMQLLCQVTNTYSEHDVATDRQLEKRYAIEANDRQLSPLKEVLQLRRLDVIICCKNDSELHIRGCVDHIRMKRIDTLCSRESTEHAPFTVFRDVFMKDRVAHCCYKLAAHRYHCFGEGAKQVMFESHEEYSQDETDPINDIWNYQLNTTLLNEALNSASPEQARQLIDKLDGDGDRARQSRDLQEGKVDVIDQDTLSGNTSVPQPAEKKVRHPGAILESFRRHADKEGNITSSRSAFSRMSGSEIRDLVSSLEQQWWVPKSEGNSSTSKGFESSVLNAKQGSEPVEHTSHAEHEVSEEDAAASKAIIGQKTGLETSHHKTNTTGSPMIQINTDKRDTQNGTVNKGRNCTFSILGYDQMKGKSLHEILRKKFKHDKFGNQ